jgi:hypothetical protein
MPGPPLRQRLMGSWRGAGQFLGSVHYVSLIADGCTCFMTDCAVIWVTYRSDPRTARLRVTLVTAPALRLP